ncbi:ATP-binding protein [Streptomyces sp. NPDC091281]|uniref:ATP-binding protein n=1 Tax=Streptomyces sp. NPDC091281 TaxID=3365985 RepID=UPI0038147D4A
MNHYQGHDEPFYFSRRARFVDQLNLVAVASAVSVSRHFVRLTLGKWQAGSVEGDAALVVSELVTNAIKVSGVLDRQPTWAEMDALALVTVRLIGLDASIVVEVGDASQEQPVLRRPDGDAEGGRGLLLVEEIAENWGSYRTRRGKAVWAEIPVPEVTPSGLPRRRRLERTDVRPTVRADAWLLRSLLVGLQAL